MCENYKNLRASPQIMSYPNCSAIFGVNFYRLRVILRSFRCGSVVNFYYLLK